MLEEHSAEKRSGAEISPNKKTWQYLIKKYMKDSSPSIHTQVSCVPGLFI